MNCLALFFAGALLCNCLPHLAAGLRGEPFPSPFSKPRGVGPSSPLVNFLWGAFNLFLGLYILSRHPVAIGLNWEFAALAAGALVIGCHLSIHFGHVRRNKIKS
jgi:hypothetical protein